MCPRVVDVTLPREARSPVRARVPLLSTSHICPLRPFPIYFFSTTIVPALLVSMSTRSANREELIGLAAGHRSVRAPRRACPRSSVARPTAQCSWPKPNGSNPLCLLWSPQWQQCVQWCYTFGSAAQWTKPWNCEKKVGKSYLKHLAQGSLQIPFALFPNGICLLWFLLWTLFEEFVPSVIIKSVVL